MRPGGAVAGDGDVHYEQAEDGSEARLLTMGGKRAQEGAEGTGCAWGGLQINVLVPLDVRQRSDVYGAAGRYRLTLS